MLKMWRAGKAWRDVNALWGRHYRLLTEGSGRQKKTAAGVLNQFQALPFLCRKLADLPDDTKKCGHIYQVIHLTNPSTSRNLLHAMGDRDPKVRAGAGRAYREFVKVAAVDPGLMTKVIDDLKNLGVKEDALELALHSIRDAYATADRKALMNQPLLNAEGLMNALMTGFMEESSPKVALAAAEVLQHTGTKDHVDDLLKLRSRFKRQRENAGVETVDGVLKSVSVRPGDD